ncbi:MAG: SAP domain-containing protein [Candidatus Acidiferrales bacterium]
MSSAPSKTDPTWTLAHLMLLGKYSRGRQLEMGGHAYPDQQWKGALGESLQDATKRFAESGLLEECPLSYRVMSKFNQIVLKQMLRQRGLKVSGRKDELAKRLVEADRDGMFEATSEFVMMQCTDKGRYLANEFSERTEEMQQAALQALRRRDLESAIQYVCHYQDALGFPEAPFFPSKPNASDLRRTFSVKPKILGSISDEVLESLRVAAGMGFLGIRGKWISDDLETGVAMDGASAVAMIISKVQNDRNLESYRLSEVTRIRIIGSADGSCLSCAKIQRKMWNLKDVPEIPYERCTSEGGCRCCCIIA